jgi:hypothetical protein
MKSSKSGFDILISEISRTDSLDWSEFDFFKKGVGLSKNDQLSNRICLDYERALESRRLVRVVSSLSSEEKQRMLNRSLQLSSRFVLRFDTGLQSRILAVCVAATWFPKHWLSASVNEQQKVVESLARIYDVRPLTVFDFPIEDWREQKLVVASAQEDRNTTLHVFAIDRGQTESALIAGFKAWLKKQPDISGAESRQGKVKVIAALRDLGRYRLMTKLDASSRQATMDEAHFNQSVPKLSEAKRRAEKRLQSLGYI